VSDDASLQSRLRALTPQLRFGLRVTVAALLAFVLVKGFALPFNGLWAVLTAIIVSQLSVGGSLRATIDYNIGTLAGALLAVAVGLSVPHATPWGQALVLALTVGPLAFAASIWPNFRVAPFSAVIVLFIGNELGESALQSGITRVFEVMIGGSVAVAVSLLVFPQRAQALGLEAACKILNEMAAFLPVLLARVSKSGDGSDDAEAQKRIGDMVATFQGLAKEALRERIVSLAREPDAAPLARALLRVRNDFVLLGRATGSPFPEPVAGRIEKAAANVGQAASAFLSAASAAIARLGPPPSNEATEAALAAFSGEIAAVRSEGRFRAMATGDVERIFALGFGLEQLCRDLAELGQHIREQAE
jgi:uncharacterized membrane protein YccC